MDGAIGRGRWATGQLEPVGGWYRSPGTQSPGTKSSRRVTRVATALLLVLNLLDGVFTLTYLELGLAEELNPLMARLYEVAPLSFMIVKLALVQFGVALLWKYRLTRPARYALRGGAALYAAIVAYHLSFLIHLTLSP